MAIESDLLRDVWSSGTENLFFVFVFLVDPPSRFGLALILHDPVLVVESALDVLTCPCQFSPDLSRQNAPKPRPRCTRAQTPPTVDMLL